MTLSSFFKLVAIFGFSMAVSCIHKRTPPIRPAQVPDSAIWSGGTEGGAWYDCTVDFNSNINVCAVYSETDGKLGFKASYKLNVNRAASAEELKDPVIDVLNGYCIYLADQKTLVPVEVLFKAKD